MGLSPVYESFYRISLMCVIFREALYHSQSLCSEFEGHEGGIVGEDSSSDLEQVNEGLPLSTKAVDDVLIVISDGRLEEE